MDKNAFKQFTESKKYDIIELHTIHSEKNIHFMPCPLMTAQVCKIVLYSRDLQYTYSAVGKNQSEKAQRGIICNLSLIIWEGL